jgi:hypothetical protein
LPDGGWSRGLEGEPDERIDQSCNGRIVSRGIFLSVDAATYRLSGEEHRSSSRSGNRP